MTEIMICPVCKAFSLQKEHCINTLSPRPPKFSPEDRFQGYKREAKKEELKKKGLL